ncbi:hypothetical protein [Sciscionella marina]|uniref:hypothetical protein n=1 Tax=Sciscionella marina TaxID=508770 RepID=UPI00036CFDC6|nr:hypothetical protein [Sciscionella marina]
MTEDPFAGARAVADAVLYEGYLLYPYRASAAKNQIRWQFGVLGPPSPAGAVPVEPSTMATDCLIEGTGGGQIAIRARFLQLQARTVQRCAGERRFVATEELHGTDGSWVNWDEAHEHERNLGWFDLDALTTTAQSVPISVPGGVDLEDQHGDSGAVIGRLVRRRWAAEAVLRVSCAAGTGPVRRLRLELRNTTGSGAVEEPTEPDDRHTDDRTRALRHALLSAHLVLHAENARFASVIDPPPWAGAAAARCRSDRLWPVLLGEPESADTVLAAPIILPDHPRIAEHSRGALFDSTEIDELLSLRVMTMTEEEKRQARATDPRAAEIVDRCEHMSAADLARMHGIGTLAGGAPEPVPTWYTPAETGGAPWWDPAVDAAVDPASDTVEVDGVAIGRGSAVLLRPGARADAQDLFFAGQVATVVGVHHDVDGRIHLAVLLRDDPASELHEWYGRYLYFGTGEVEPLPAEGKEAM